jgi:hypothetical protein
VALRRRLRNIAGNRRQVQPSRAKCHKAWSMIRVDQTRWRPILGCGSIMSIIRASRTIMPRRTISWMAGAYLRRSSAVHAICRLLGRIDRSAQTAAAASQNSKLLNISAFEQALTLPGQFNR